MSWTCTYTRGALISASILFDDSRLSSSPIEKRQEAFQSSVIDRIKALEEQLKSTMNADRPAQKRLPLATSSQTNVPVSRVRPLMAKSQPALCKTPSAAKDVIVLDTPSPNCMQVENSTADAIPTVCAL